MGPHFDPEHRLDKPATSPNGGALVPVAGMHAPMTPVPYRPQALMAMPNALAILVALRRRWLAAAVVGVLCAAVVCTIMWLHAPEPFWAAHATIAIAEQKPIIGPTPESGESVFIAKQIGLIRSRTVMGQAAQELQASDKISFLPKHLTTAQATDALLERGVSVGLGDSPDIIVVGMIGDPEETVPVLNAVIKAFLAKTGDAEYQHRREMIGQRSKYLEGIANKIKGFEVLLKNEEKKETRKEPIGPVIPQRLEFRLGIANKMLMDSQDELRGVLHKIKSVFGQMRELVVRQQGAVGEEFAAMMATFPKPGSPISLAVVEITARAWQGYSDATLLEEMQKDPVLEALVIEIRELEQYRDWYARVTPLTPLGAESEEVKKYQSDLLLKRKTLQGYIQTLRPQVIDQLRSKARLEMLTQQNQLQTELRQLTQQANLLKDDILSFEQRGDEIAATSLAVQKIMEMIGTWQSFYNQVKSGIDNLEVELGQLLRVSKRDDAAAGLVDNRPRHMLLTGAAGVGTIALVLLAFGWWEYRMRKLSSADEVVQTLGMQLLGALPDYTHRRGLLPFLRSGDEEQWQHMLAESVDTARTMVLHAAQTEGLRVVMVTSSMPGEGKTSSATHLAASLARSGRKTLLVDCDLRNPTAHRLFQMTRTPGFADVLQGQADLASVIRETPVEGLSVITAGHTTGLAMQALGRGGAQPLFAQLRQQFDFIIVDSCPVLPVADSLLLGACVDAVIFAVLRDVSRMPRVYEAYRRLAVLGVRTLGAMVSGVRDKVHSRGYSYASAVEE